MQHSSILGVGPYCGLLLPEPRPLGDPVDSDPTPPCDTYPKAWEHRKEVQVTPDTVTTLAFVTEEPTV